MTAGRRIPRSCLSVGVHRMRPMEVLAGVPTQDLQAVFGYVLQSFWDAAPVPLSRKDMEARFTAALPELVQVTVFFLAGVRDTVGDFWQREVGLVQH